MEVCGGGVALSAAGALDPAGESVPGGGQMNNHGNESLPGALVTGSSSGFGLLTCIELAQKGFRVFASMRDLSRSDRLDETAAQAGVTVEKLHLDVTDPASITAALDEIHRSGGQIEVLVNNAGFGMGGAFEDLQMDELREQFETNFFGLAAVTRAVLPQMRQRRRGRIINVSSISGRIGFPGLSAYCASKFAVEGLSETLRLELQPFGIKVVLIEPGSYRTDIFERNRRMARDAHDPASPYYSFTRGMEAYVDKKVARSTADPAEVARAIARAATEPDPPLRCLVGRDARLQSLLRAVIPARWFEALILKQLGRVR